MYKKRGGLFFLCLVLLQVSNCFATHIVGGVLTYRDTTNNDYIINLTIYRDCFNGIPYFSNPALVIAFDSNNIAVDTLTLTLGPVENIPDPTIYQNACHYKLPSICYHQGSYTGIINLPYKPGGYTLAYENCCWNQTIDNIVFGGNLVVKTDISDSTLLNGNDAPVYKDLTPSVVCQGLPFGFDHSAIDKDGDSLSYELFTPFEGTVPPYSRVPYQLGYSLTNLTNSVVELKIDSITGWLSATIDSLGQYVYGVRVKEYRDGTYIGSTWRTYQINAASCDTLNVVADFSYTQEPCTENLIQFQIDSTNADQFLWKIGNTTMGSGSNPSYAFQDTGKHTISIIGSFNNLDCKDTVEAEIYIDTILSEDLVKANFNVTDNYCVKEIAFENTSVYGVDFSWDFGDASPPAGSTNPTHTFQDTGTYLINLLAISNTNKCRDSIQKQIRILEKIALDPSYTKEPCSNELIFASNVTDTTIGDYQLHWDFGNEDTSMSLNPVYVYNDSGLYQIRLIADFNGNHFGCNDTSYLSYLAQPTTFPSFNVSASHRRVISTSDSVSLLVEPANYLRYQWLPIQSLSNPNIPNPKAKPTRTTTYTVLVTNSIGCTIEDTITITASKILCGESEVFVPNSFTPNGDGENDYFRVRGKDIKELYFAVYNRWGEIVFESSDVNMNSDESKGWDGRYKDKDSNPGVFVYYLRLICFGDEEFIKKGNVTLIR